MNEITEFIDENPERDFGNSERLAYVLGITDRQVRRLAADRILPREADGTFHLLRCSDAYIAYKLAPPPAGQEALARRQLALLERRIARETDKEIEMLDALETFDLITGVFIQAIDAIGDEAAAVAEDPARAALVMEHTKTELAEKFAAHRHALVVGRKGKR